MSMYKHIIFDFGVVFLNLMGQHSGVPKQLSEALSIPESDAERLCLSKLFPDGVWSLGKPI